MVREGDETKVLNFAVQGYSTLQEVETLRTKALALKPRGVLLQYFMNDEEIYTALFIGILEDRRKRNEVGYVEAFHSVDPGDSWLVRKLLLSRTAIAIRLGLARLTAPSGDAAPSTDAIYEYYTKNSPVREGLEDLKRIAADHDLPVLVLIFPHACGAHADRMGTPLPELDEYPNAWVFDSARILGLCRELGFTCVDLDGQAVRESEAPPPPSRAPASSTAAATSASSATRSWPGSHTTSCSGRGGSSVEARRHVPRFRPCVRPLCSARAPPRARCCPRRSARRCGRARRSAPRGGARPASSKSASCARVARDARRGDADQAQRDRRAMRLPERERDRGERVAVVGRPRPASPAA